MLRIAIAIDGWKLSIFERHLAGAGYEFEQHPGVSEGTLTLIAITHDFAGLEKVVRAANTEAQRRKMN